MVTFLETEGILGNDKDIKVFLLFALVYKSSQLLIFDMTFLAFPFYVVDSSNPRYSVCVSVVDD